jgi:arylsulfatase
MGDWKAVRQNMLRKNNDPLRIFLYNLAEDIGETTDVAAEHPEVVAQVREVMQREHVPSELFRFRPIDRESAAASR